MPPNVSQPQPYSPQHAFVADSATVPNFPGQSLDIEFQDVKSTTDQILANLALIQRDDGALKNGTVTYDTLSATLQTNGLATAATWLTAINYTVGTTVYQNFNLYRCLIAHTAGVFATDLAAAKWLLLVALPQGPSGTLAVHSTSTLAAGQPATVVNVGTSQAAQLDFGIPQGIQGVQGPAGPAYGGTSATSLLIANSTTKTFTTQAGLAYQVGTYARASSAANGANFMEGLVSSYSATTMAIAVTKIGGSGTFADWGFSVSGAPGVGDLISTNNLSDVTNAGTARTNLGLAIGTNVQAFDAQLSSLIPQNSQSAAYGLVLTDGEKHILHPSADTTARTFTIPANASVAYPIGTTVTFVNQNAAGVLTIAITTDTMRLAGAGTTGSRTLAANGIATALKITATEWIISGSGLS
jgi:hypothetical protein